MKLTELENEYDIYKDKTELQIIELRDKVKSHEVNGETEDSLRGQLLEQKFQTQ